jgi:hypothetical protein
MLQKLLIFLGIYNPFTHTSEDFILRIVSSSFSNDYIVFEYSANRGRGWKTIQCCKDPFLRSEDWYTMGDLTFRLGNGEFSSEKEKFSTYREILDYEKAQREKRDLKNNELAKHRDQLEKNKEEAYKRANS